MCALPVDEGTRVYTPISRINQDVADFDRAVQGAQGRQTSAAPGHDPVNPPVFGANEPEAGIAISIIEPGGLWPQQIYRSSPFGYETNEDLQKQLAATPELDPQSFGNRPGVPYGADLGLRPGDKVIVLDETRLGLLEEQRALLGEVMPAGEARTIAQIDRRDSQISDLAESIAAEIDYAALGQAVPDFDATAANISARAPNDPVYQQAIALAKQRLEATWKAQGRTHDQIGKVLELGQVGDFGGVRDLTSQQSIEIAESLGPNARPEEISAAILARTSVYTKYVTSDSRYVDAVKAGAAAASHEMLVERPIQTVLDIANAEGEDRQSKAVHQLRTITDPTTHMPDQVLAILEDSRIQKVVQQSLRHAETLDAPAKGPVWSGWTADAAILSDLTAIYDAAFYADGGTPGRGKKLVDDMAGFILANTGRYTERDDLNAMTSREVGSTWNAVFYNAASEGHIALALAVGAKARGGDNPVFTQGWSPEEAVADGIHNYALHVETLAKTADEDSAFIKNPLKSVGAQHLPEERRLALIDDLIAAADPKDVDKLVADIRAWQQALQGREPMKFALDAYGPALRGAEGYDRAVGEHAKIPEGDPLSTASGLDSSKSYWTLRAARLFATTFIEHWLPDGIKGPFDRGSRLYSTYLFTANAATLLDSSTKFLDWPYIPLHSAMVISEASKAVLPTDWQKEFFGTNAAGDARAPIAVSDAGVEKIRASHLDPRIKNVLLSVADAPLDAIYFGTDLYNTVSYFAGWNTKDNKRDLVRGFAFGLATGSDASFLAAALANARSVPGVKGLVAGRTAFFWGGLGAALFFAGATVNNIKTLHENAHKFDAANAKAWELLGIQHPEVAKALGIGATFADADANKNAGPFLGELFRNAGYSTDEMIAFINQNWSPAQADQIATHIKLVATKRDDGTYTQEDFASVEIYAENVGLTFPDRYNKANSPFQPDPNAPTWEWVGP